MGLCRRTVEGSYSEQKKNTHIGRVFETRMEERIHCISRMPWRFMKFSLFFLSHILCVFFQRNSIQLFNHRNNSAVWFDWMGWSLVSCEATMMSLRDICIHSHPKRSRAAAVASAIFMNRNDQIIDWDTHIYIQTYYL